MSSGEQRRSLVRPAEGWWRRFVNALAIPAVFTVIWAVVSQTGLIRSLFLPSPQIMWATLQELAPLLPPAIASTLTMTISGFVVGTTVGGLFGLTLAYSARVREYVGPLMDFVRPVPVFALIPLFVLWFGVGRTPQILLVALGCAVVLAVSTLEAVRNVPQTYVAAALTLGANRRRIYRTVVIPWVLPHVVGAIRVAAALAWGLGVAAEFMGSQQGLGYLIILQQTYLRTAGIMLLVIVYSFLAFGFDLLIAAVERRLTRWSARHGSSGPASAIGTQIRRSSHRSDNATNRTNHEKGEPMTRDSESNKARDHGGARMLTLLLALLLVVAACGGDAEPPDESTAATTTTVEDGGDGGDDTTTTTTEPESNGGEPVVVNVAMTPFYDYQFFAVADEMGWDTELGVDIQFEWFAQSGPSIQALARGDVDTVNTCVVCNYPFYESVPELRNFLTVNQFKGFSIIGRVDSSRTYTDFLEELGDPAAAQQAVIEQFDGATIPMYEANYSSLLSATLEQADLTLDDVNIVNFAEDDLAAVAFVGGTGDFYLGGLPSQVNILLEHGEDYQVVAGAEALGPAGLWYSQVASTEDWLTTNEDVALALMAMSYRYNRYVNERPDEVFPIVADTIRANGGPDTTLDELALIFDEFLEFRSYQDERETTYNPDSDLYWRHSAEYYVAQSEDLPEDADYELQNPLEDWFNKFLARADLLEWVDADL